MNMHVTDFPPFAPPRSASIAWRCSPRPTPAAPSAHKDRRRMTMEPRISVLTLGVSDVEAASAFYTKVGLSRSREGDDSVSFFQLGGGLVLALFGREDLGAESGIAREAWRPGGMTIGYNTRSKLEVDRLVAAFVAAGGRLLKEPGKTFWGGYCGYVADVDGHAWEIAFNPHWELDAEGGLTLPG
jgi:predicted lactoylglutathione lyase